MNKNGVQKRETLNNPDPSGDDHKKSSQFQNLAANYLKYVNFSLKLVQKPVCLG
jgi:hypothetical protein